MKILAMDIGAGTQDILLYDSGRTLENCLKMILPSPSSLYSIKIAGVAEDLFLYGRQVGGGRLSKIIRQHLEKGYEVYMTEEVAYTIRNNLEDVISLGIKIVKEAPSGFKGQKMKLEEVNIGFISDFLSHFNENIEALDALAIAVQDHGSYPRGQSNRKLRLRRMREKLEEKREISALAFTQVPPHFSRMRSAVECCREQLPEAKVLVMDTAPAAILGCLADEEVKRYSRVLAVNVGNSHTMASLVQDGMVCGLFEHHTHKLNPEKLELFLKKFSNAQLKDEEIFEDGGHGVFYLEKFTGFSRLDIIAVTGPSQSIFQRTKLNYHWARLGGDTMMVGPMGLVLSARAKFQLTLGRRDFPGPLQSSRATLANHN